MYILEDVLKSAFDDDIVNDTIIVPEGIREISELAFLDVNAKKIILPSTLEVIGSQAFSSCAELLEINIPENVNFIGSSAFSNCGKLKSISLPDNLKDLPEGIFNSCQELQNIKLPKYLETIGKKAFYSCNSLQEIEIPDSVFFITDEAFSHCTDLKTIKFPINLIEIGEQAFQYCDSLEEITFPNNLKRIQPSCFQECNSLKQINFNNNLEYIGNYAFDGCESLKNIELPESISKIGYSAFSFDTSLESVKFPDTLRTLPSNIFEHCEKLSSVKLPKNLLDIGSEAFKYCVSLKIIDLPESLELIGDHSFNSSGISKIEFPKNINYIGESAFANCNGLENVILPNNLEVLNLNTFLSCKNLKSATLPQGLKSIKKQAFSGCTKLSSINIPSSVEEIRFRAFSETALKNIKLPDNINYLGDEVFYNCQKLETVKLPKNLKEIPSNSFFGCVSLKEISLPENVEKINSSAFSYCINLKNISFPKTLTLIDYSSFSNCSGLDTIILPDSVKYLGSCSFSNCRNLKNIKLSENLTDIPAIAFENCASLDKIILPDAITKIANGAFKHCHNLKFVKFPENLQTIEDFAFKECYSLKNIELPKNLTALGNLSFSSCQNLKFITIPESIEVISNDPFFDCSNLNQVTFPKTLKFISPIASRNFRFFKKEINGFSLLLNQDKDSLPLSELKINPAVLSCAWKNKDILLKDQTNPLFAMLYNYLLPQLDNAQANEFVNHHNFRFLKQYYNPNLISENEPNNIEDLDVDETAKFFRALYNLGAFTVPFEENGKTFNYAQKVNEFLLQKFHNQELKPETLGDYFKDTQTKPFNKEFTDFYLANFDKFLDQEMIKYGFTARCFNEYEIVQKTNTSHRGSQRQLKPTIEKFVDYFNENKFVGITKETKPLSDVISPYCSNQENFDDAVKIFKEIKENNVPSNILGFHLTEKNAFEHIDEYSKKIHELKRKILGNFAEIATQEFSYDWLEKNDPQNLILGNLCNCCAHLDGVGFGIMRASIIHPSIQNLVIRNNQNEIIAKSTLFVNEKEGYGVCNNVEVNNSVDERYLPSIYQKYMMGIEAFAKAYNKTHKNNPLKIINVGMNFNDLSEDIEKLNDESPIILKAPNYSDFCYDGIGHAGDSASRQYIVWKLDKEPTNENEMS